jgi:hypothetical protein
MNPPKPKVTRSPSAASRWHKIYNQQLANAELINRHVKALRLQHGTPLTRRGLSELGYALGLSGFSDAAPHTPFARIQAGELAEARHEERLNGKKKSEPEEISYARRLVLLKLADRFLCGS